MSNRFGIPEEVEQRIRRRDKACVYCHMIMREYSYREATRNGMATIEHFREEGPFYWKEDLKEEDLAICCHSCNSRRGRRKLVDWFKTSYCVEKNINEETVATPVKEYLRRNER